jgi:hypothetical protein
MLKKRIQNKMEVNIMVTIIIVIGSIITNASVLWFILNKYMTKVDILEKEQKEMKYNYMDRFADLKSFVDEKINVLLEKILDNK